MAGQGTGRAGELLMRWSIVWICATFALAPGSLSAAPGLPLIPPAYWGEFSPNPAYCGLPIYMDDDAPKIAASNNRIWVRADYVRNFAHRRHVVAVIKSPRGLILQFDLQIDEFPPPGRFELSKDGEVLNHRWRRCHVKEK